VNYIKKYKLVKALNTFYRDEEDISIEDFKSILNKYGDKKEESKKNTNNLIHQLSSYGLTLDEVEQICLDLKKVNKLKEDKK
jgi:hypothetical protein